MSSHDPHPDDIDVKGTMNAWVIAAIAPILIMLLVGSLTYFLIDIFYQGDFNVRVKYILSLFIMATVLIARISIEEGRGYATMYAIPLALATWFVTSRFVVFEDNILGVLSVLIMPFLLALIWWSADRLTWDCTVVDFSQDVSNQGLLRSISERMRDVRRTGAALADMNARRNDRQSPATQEASETDSTRRDASSNPPTNAGSERQSSWQREGAPEHAHPNTVSAATFGLDESGNVIDPSRMDLDGGLYGTTSTSPQEKPPWWKTLPIFQRRQNTPGVWVFYFSLAAIPIFGLGQAFVPASNVDTRRWLFLYFVIYTMAGLGLLLTTSLLSLQRYLRQRNVEMPNPVAVTWVVAGGIGIVGILAVVWLLPRPAPEYSWIPNPIRIVSSDKLRSSRYGWGNEGVQDEQQNKSTTPGQTEQGGSTPDSKGGSPSQSSNSQQSSKSPTQSPPPDDNSNSAQNSSQQSSSSQQQSGEGGQSGSDQSSSSNPSANQSSAGNDQSQQQQNQSSQSSNGGSADSHQSGDEQDSASDQNSSDTSQNQSDDNQTASRDSKNGNGNQSSSSSPENQEPQRDGQRNGQRDGKRDGQRDGQSDQQSDQQSDRKEETENSQGQSSSNGSTSNGSSSRPSESNRAQDSTQSRSSAGDEKTSASRNDNSSRPNAFNQGLSWLSTIARYFKWILAAIVLLVIIVLAWRYRDQLVEAWQQFVARWREFLDRLFGRRPSSSSSAEEPEADEKVILPNFTAFRDPFESGEWDQWTSKQLLAYTFNAFEAWGRDRNCPREADLTPREYALQVARHDRDVGRAAGKLADLYAEVAYSNAPTSSGSTESVRGFWQVMRRRYRASVRTPASLPRES